MEAYRDLVLALEVQHGIGKGGQHASKQRHGAAGQSHTQLRVEEGRARGTGRVVPAMRHERGSDLYSMCPSTLSRVA